MISKKFRALFEVKKRAIFKMGRDKKKDGKSKIWCVVPGCKSDARKNKEKHEFMEGVEFYPFPTKRKDMKLRKQWLKMIERPLDYDPPAWHRVCSRHFVGGKMGPGSEIPELFPKNNFKQPLKERPDHSIQKRKMLVPVKPSSKRTCRKLQLEAENATQIEGL